MDWPIYWCIDPGVQIELWEFQRDNYGDNLQAPPLPKDFVDTEIESIEEISKIMKMPPHHQRKIT